MSAKTNQGSVKPSKTATDLFNWLKARSHYGQVAIECSDQQIMDVMGCSERSVQRYLKILKDAGLIECKIEFDNVKRIKHRLLFVIMPNKANNKSSQLDSDNRSYHELLLEKLSDLELETADYDDVFLRHVIGKERCVLFAEGEIKQCEEAWLKLFSLSLVNGLRQQAESCEYLDQFTLGYNYFNLYLQQVEHITAFKEKVSKRSLIDWAQNNQGEQESLELSTNLLPFTQQVSEELVAEANYVFNTYSECNFGLELIPSTILLTHNQNKSVLKHDVFFYMQANHLGVFSTLGHEYLFEPVYSTLRALHGYTHTAIDVCQSLQKVIDSTMTSNHTIQTKNHLDGACGIASFMILGKIKRQNFKFDVPLSLSEDDALKPVRKDAEIEVCRKNGLTKKQTDFLNTVSSVFFYNVNSNINIYSNPAYRFAHPSAAVYDLRACAAQVKWGKLVPPSSLAFDFSCYHLDLKALAEDPEGFYQPKLTILQWLEYIWFDMAYRLFVDPDTFLFGDINALKPSGENIQEWLLSRAGLRHGIVRELYSIYYDDLSILAKQISYTLKKGSKSARQFVKATICKDLTQICVDHLNPQYVLSKTDDNFPSKALQKIRKLIYEIDYRAYQFNFNIFGFGIPDPTKPFNAENILKNSPPLFSKLAILKNHFVLKEPSFLIIRAQALSLLCMDNHGKSKAARFDNNPAKLYCALAEREEDQRQWRMICRSFLPKDFDIYVK